MLGISMKTDAVYCGDCQFVLGNTNEFPEESVDLIYADPPFFSNRNYEVIWGDGYERRAFVDRWKGGAHGVQNYVSWMKPKIEECHRILKKTGSMYLHCDWHANAYLRILMDQVFTESHFRNEIIWYYRGGGVPKDSFAKRHDTILFYTKGTDWTFNVDAVRTEYSAESLERLQYKARSFRGKKVYDNYEANPKGKHPDDVLEIQPTMPSSKERLGYPTQKPERLLEVLVKASSNKGDVVLDPFCGCGTSIAVAQKLGRKWVGVDVSPTACQLIVKRMRSLGVAIKRDDVIGLPKTETQLRSMEPFEFQNWVFRTLHGRVSTRLRGDMGIDGHVMGEPVQVKQSEGVGRNVVDNFHAAIVRDKKTKGTIVALSFGSGAYEEVARLKNEGGLEITLKTLKDLLEED